MEALGAIEATLRSQDQRITANHDSVSRLRSEQGKQGTEIAVIHTELGAARRDIEDMHKELIVFQDWVRKSLWKAAALLLTLNASVGTLIVLLSTGSHG